MATKTIRKVPFINSDDIQSLYQFVTLEAFKYPSISAQAATIEKFSEAVRIVQRDNPAADRVKFLRLVDKHLAACVKFYADHQERVLDGTTGLGIDGESDTAILLHAELEVHRFGAQCALDAHRIWCEVDKKARK